MDRLVVFEQNGQTQRECVECGFRDSQAETAPRQELKTRVNQPQETSQPEPDDEVQPIKIIR